ncbi:LytTR family DNA-binding domain-containing protein [Shewanella nanhaiensis]|uniref:LytTR family transcriptional regulator n=1 Tax=Shewanella nanhaiensis TaxID=2864872 RepID=A0ABS7E1P9_9GAMM|nr:LytTR family DNA-binding domain-containing protein [Shewanella nanhaiensis]MBW8183544.1 LytTR family transcriptional regulator [Shewanella nanhaiensis]
MPLTPLHFQNNKTRYETLALLVYFFINASINATSETMEAGREQSVNFVIWEPFVWEFSSAISTLILFPFIALFMTKKPWQWQHSSSSFLTYLVAAFVFSFCHIGLMVSIREFSYLFSSLDYDFAKSTAELGYELIYELRKDLWSFCFFVIVIAAYRQVVAQYLGDVRCIDTEQKEAKSLTKLLLVKKLGKEFLIKTEQIEWVQSAGNYVNLHIEDQVYPTRSTLAEFIERDASHALCRIHRSFAVNLNYVNYIEPMPSGDAELTLHSGKKLRISRRYKEEFHRIKTESVGST